MKYLIVLFIFFSFKLFSQVEGSIDADRTEKINKILSQDDIYKYKNELLPKFELVDLEGNLVSSKTLKGKPTLINFWFTNCAPCIEEIPMLNELKNNYDSEVNFIAITYQDSAVIKSFLHKTDFKFLHLVNSEEYLKTFGIFLYPKIIILDKNLKVLHIEKGNVKNKDDKADNNSKFKKKISTLLETLL